MPSRAAYLIALAILGGHVMIETKAGRASAGASTTLHRYLLSIPKSEPHHICLAGNHAHKLMELAVLQDGHNLTEYEMESKAAPENKCKVHDYHMGNTLFLVAGALEDRCAARWKAHSSSCDVLIHAHSGSDCNQLWKFRMISNQCEAPLVVVHTTPDLLSCYQAKAAKAAETYLNPLEGKCSDLQRSVLLQESDDGSKVVRALVSALQQTSEMVKTRYAEHMGDHLAEKANNTADEKRRLRELIYKHKANNGHELMLELMKYAQGLPHDSGALKVAKKVINKKTQQKVAQRHSGKANPVLNPVVNPVMNRVLAADVGLQDPSSFAQIVDGTADNSSDLIETPDNSSLPQAANSHKDSASEMGTTNDSLHPNDTPDPSSLPQTADSDELAVSEDEDDAGSSNENDENAGLNGGAQNGTNGVSNRDAGDAVQSSDEDEDNRGTNGVPNTDAGDGVTNAGQNSDGSNGVSNGDASQVTGVSNSNGASNDDGSTNTGDGAQNVANGSDDAGDTDSRVIIIDTGSGFVKLGVAEKLKGPHPTRKGDKDEPEVVIRNVVGKPKYPHVLIGRDLKEFEPQDTRGRPTPNGYSYGLYKGDNPDCPGPACAVTDLAGAPGDQRKPTAASYDLPLKKMIEDAGGTAPSGNFTFDNGKRGIMSIVTPMKYGIIQEKMEYVQQAIWERGLTELSKKLERQSEAWHNDYVIATEAPLNKIKMREMTVDFFRNQLFRGIYVGSQAILAMYAYGKSTGMVLDIGDGTTHIVPIFEGYALPHAIKRLDIGGADLTTFLGRILTERDDNYGRRFVATPELEILRKMKETIAKVAPNDDAWQALNSNKYGEGGTKELSGNPIDCPGERCVDSKNNALNNAELYTLPDGESITYADQKWRVYEPLFDPMLIGMETPSIPEMIHQTIKECDMDIRRQMYSHIFLSGGTCAADNFDKRLEFELEKLIEKEFNGLDQATGAVLDEREKRRPTVNVEDRGGGRFVRDAVFHGAYILPSLDGFDKLMLQLKTDASISYQNQETHKIWNYADVRTNRHMVAPVVDNAPQTWQDSQEHGWKPEGDRPGENVGDPPERIADATATEDETEDE